LSYALPALNANCEIRGSGGGDDDDDLKAQDDILLHPQAGHRSMAGDGDGEGIAAGIWSFVKSFQHSFLL